MNQFAHFIVVLVIVALSCGQSVAHELGEGPATEEKINEVCSRVQNVDIADDEPLQPADMKQPNACNSSELYDEALESEPPSSKKWKSVQTCARVQHDDLVLAMLYANGFGVAKNLDIAVKYSCRSLEKVGEDGDIENIIRGLLEFQEDARLNKERPGCTEKCDEMPIKVTRIFDICEHAGNPSFVGYCDSRKEAGKSRHRNSRLDALQNKLSVDELNAFKKLRAAVATLAEDRTREVDTMGTGRASWMIEARAEQMDQFMDDLTACENGTFPAGDATEARTSDRTLNQLYSSSMHAKTEGDEPDAIGYSNILKSHVRKTERDWIRYRDAWVAFAQLRCPAVKKSAWNKMLTDQRIVQLDALLKENL